MFKKLIPAFLFFIALSSYAQKAPLFTHADTLRGKLTAERRCYNAYYYDLHLKINTDKHFIIGYNVIDFKVDTTFTRMQVDLFKTMDVDSIMHGNTKLTYTRDSNAMFISFTSPEMQGIHDSIKVFYHGYPQTAKRPPWDGGFVWEKDTTGKTWVDVACEGTGASLWWPCKDHLSDKPDSMRMSFDVPDGLMCVSNGRLRSKTKTDSNYTRFVWFVSAPIINYDVTVNIADYAHISDYYLSGKDTLTLDYYVLKYNVRKALMQFAQVKKMLACYEKFFGPYPFIKDGYKLVETNYWGMEHQSCVAYGNNYKTEKPYGFDFIIIHESAHEWWGNSLSCRDAADMWLHEAFATYAEALYVECTKGYSTSIDYLKMQQEKVGNKYPVIGPYYDVNFQGTENDDDMYYKGTWMLHTFRHVLNNDSLFFAILIGLQKRFYHSSTNTAEVLAYIDTLAGKDYKPFFDQYLNYASLPVFNYKFTTDKNGKRVLNYRWIAQAKDFSMPIKVKYQSAIVDSNTITNLTLTPTAKWQTIKLPNITDPMFYVDTDEFYVEVKREKNQ
ncbi:MAG TPA: M1 family metallopeptidase [Bacteroidia bacterium]|jgi:aminopeptidase N|nr:M1 family metallopeptidase [Bacteroidia bacterium]